WHDARHADAGLSASGLHVAAAGVDGPHLGLDRYDRVAGHPEGAPALRLGLSHSPEPRVLDQFAASGYDLVLAGHTHGGQLRLPVKGALVTNCDLDTPRARGLHRHPAGSAAGTPGSSWLHLSAGAGTPPYAGARFWCRPEA